MSAFCDGRKHLPVIQQYLEINASICEKALIVNGSNKAIKTVPFMIFCKVSKCLENCQEANIDEAFDSLKPSADYRVG
jgi:hypothetical protein